MKVKHSPIRPSVPSILGERSPSDTKIRRENRQSMLDDAHLQPTDHQGIWNEITQHLRTALELRAEVLKNPADLSKYRQSLEEIVSAVTLASDDEGILAKKLRRACSKRFPTNREMPLLLHALKAFGPHRYDDPSLRRSNDRAVSRDFNATRRTLSQKIPPKDLVSFWSQPGNGLDALARKSPKRTKSIGNDGHIVVEVRMTPQYGHRIENGQSGRRGIGLFEFTAGRPKLPGLITNPRIVRELIAHARKLLKHPPL